MFLAPPRRHVLGWAAVVALPLLLLAPDTPPSQLATATTTARAQGPVQSPAQADSPPFRRVELDAAAIGIRAVGDLDGDGLPEIVARDEEDPAGKSFVWYRWPSRERFIIARGPNWRSDDIELADLDLDGDLDLLLAIDEPGDVTWYANPGPEAVTRPWPVGGHVGFTVAGGGSDSYVKDLGVADFDNDGWPDVVARTHRRVFLWRQEPGVGGAAENQWSIFSYVNIPDHEGLDLGDLDGDGDVDVVLNGFWLVNPGSRAEPVRPGQPWRQHTIDTRFSSQSGGGWQDNNAKVEVADVDGDGRDDVLLCHSEKPDFPLVWYRADDPIAAPDVWTAHPITARFDYCHSLQAGDIDLDGDTDVFTAEMPKSDDPDTLTLWLQEPGEGPDGSLDPSATTWARHDLATTGAYSALLADLGADGDLDLISCRNYNVAPLEVYENLLVDEGWTPPPRQARWAYIEVDRGRPTWGDFAEPSWMRYFGLAEADLDGDGDGDLASGRYAHVNPGGDMSAPWARVDLGHAVDASLALDVDGDDRADLLAQALPALWWLEAPGEGADAWSAAWTATRVASLPATGHSNSQGYLMADITGDGRAEALFAAADAVYAIEIPTDPSRTPWPTHRIAAGAVGAVAAADFDGDGDTDVAAFGESDGSGGPVAWWQNRGVLDVAWPRHELGRVDTGYPDRLVAADLDGDGHVDLVASEEGQPVREDYGTYWFRNPLAAGADPATTPWSRTRIATQYTTNSLDVADVDGDGDPDVITAEHRGDRRLVVWANDGAATAWERVEIDTGRENHLGARAVDPDRDGDVDLVGIGWDEPGFVHLWRQDRSGSGPGPRPRPTAVPRTAMPRLIPGNGSYPAPLTVTLEVDTPGATIHVLPNGRIPGPTDPGYPSRSTIVLDAPGRNVLTARALHPDLAPGPVAYGSYLLYDAGAPRSTTGLLALYTFEEEEGDIVRDVAPEPAGGRPLDLRIEGDALGGAVRREGGALHVTSPARVRSLFPATALVERIRSAGALTLEAWITPATAEQEGPARIISLSTDSGTRNITLGHGRWGDQPRDVYDVRLRTSTSDPNGSDSLTTPAGYTLSRLQHVVFTRDVPGARELWIDGIKVTSDEGAGDLSTWDDTMHLLLANEQDVDRPWLGAYHLVAFFDRALERMEIKQHLAAGPRNGIDGGGGVDPRPTPLPTMDPAELAWRVWLPWGLR